MSAQLNGLLEAGVLEPIDVAFAQLVGDVAGPAEPAVKLAAALASNAVQRGHVCLDLAALVSSGIRDRDGQPIQLALPELDRWQQQLRQSPLVGNESFSTPLYLDHVGRLYLSRYADYQSRLARQLLARSQRTMTTDAASATKRLEELFPLRPGQPPDRQKLAAFVALRQGLCVIAGGPGTGKTTTVAKLLILLQTQALARGKALRVLLLAPTGKAAQRLGEALAGGMERIFGAAAVLQHLPRRAFTIHNALGFQPRTPTRFRHHVDNPLAADVVLVDEASMVDLALMTKLVEAVHPRARLILLGDRDQLASVEAGAVFGDVCQAAGVGMSPAFAGAATQATGERWLPAPADTLTPLSDCVVELTRSFRYDDKSGIGQLARALNAGDADAALSVLRADHHRSHDDVAFAPLPAGELMVGPLRTVVKDGFRGYLQQRDPIDQLKQFNQFRVLCAHRRGSSGVARVNREIEQLLERAGLLACRRDFYDKRPIIISDNDYQLGLFNGDIGVVRDDVDGVSRAFFAEAAGCRAVATARLPAHETVFAMTVHKSQGSEFARVVLLLPDRPSPILTRELLYTAISRARSRVDIFGDEAVLRAAIGRRIARRSGLVDALRATAG